MSSEEASSIQWMHMIFFQCPNSRALFKNLMLDHKDDTTCVVNATMQYYKILALKILLGSFFFFTQLNPQCGNMVSLEAAYAYTGQCESWQRICKPPRYSVGLSESTDVSL